MHYVFDNQDEILKHWSAGLKTEFLSWEEIQKQPITDSVSFRSLSKRKVINHCWETGRPFYYIDTGYVGNLIKKKHYHRIVKNNVQHTNIFHAPDDRFKAITRNNPELEFVEWRKDHKGKILLVTPSEKPCMFYNIDREKWVEETVAELKKHTDRKIIVRDKGPRHARVGYDSVPWYLIKNKIYATVTYQSIAAIESICVGVPAFTMQMTAADSVVSKDLSKIESPYYPPKEQVEKWQHWLAYCQYHWRELGNGEAIKIMEKYNLL